jgi:hypothetical protein
MTPRTSTAAAATFLAAALAAIFPGCSRPAETATPAALDDAKLRNVGELYRAHQINFGKPPKSVKDLSRVATITPSGYEAVAQKQVVVRWNATLPDTKEEPGGSPSADVLAFMKDVPQSGGPVLLLDRTTRAMSADEFKAAHLAGTE